ncbi:MAG: sigma-70 family RNA polymerase sigma factor [Candidatus Acidiferrales bacterium]
MTGYDQNRADDLALIAEAKRGNRSAFARLVHKYDRAVLRVALHATGSELEAQEIYQKTFMKAYKSLFRFRLEDSFQTWIHRIVVNLCMDYLHQRYLRNQGVRVGTNSSGGEFDLLRQIADARAGANPEHDLMRSEPDSHINRALQCLTPLQRMVFELKHYHNLDLQTVGEILNVAEETARNLLLRATQKLRGALGSENKPFGEEGLLTNDRVV